MPNDPRSRFSAAVLAALLAAVLSPQPAEAYSYESVGTAGCHERITFEALRAVREELPTAGPLPTTDEERNLIDDLPFTIPDDMTDVGAASILIGVRDNDLKGAGPSELDLALIHGNPNFQREHCLRAKDQDEPGGSAPALEDCKAFIRERFVQALAGLGADGAPSPEARLDTKVTLDLRGAVEAPLPLFYVRMGQALHALQDGFTHTFRSPDGLRVRAVLNWIDYINQHDPARDGPSHRSELDRCEVGDATISRNEQLARTASIELLRAALTPALSPEQKAAEVDQILTTYLSYEPGCTPENEWCSAPELAYKESRCSCEAVGAGSPALAWAPAAAGLALLAGLRRRRRARASGAAAWVALALTVASGEAWADPQDGQGAAPPKPDDAPKAEEGPKANDAPKAEDAAKADKTKAETKSGGLLKALMPGSLEADTVGDKAGPEKGLSRVGVYAAFGASLDNSALAGTLAGRFRWSRDWIFGLDGEWNPWISLHTRDIRTGTINVYGTGIRRFRMPYENVNLRSTVNLGASILMMDLYGAPKGSVGLYFGLTFLGLEFKASENFFIIFDPLTMSFPVPQLTGAPFGYRQYRFTVGFEFASTPFG